MALIAAVPSLAILIAHRYDAASDWALMELRTRDVFSAHPPLTGAYSRYEWSHLGPLPYYLLAIPYRLFGATAESLLWAALLINTVVVGLIVWIAGRRHAAAALAASVLIMVTVAARPMPMLMHDPWNASLVVLPFVLFVVCAWSAMSGDDVAALVGLFVFIVIVQAHVGFAVVSAPLAIVAAAVVLVRRRQQRQSLSTRSRGVLGGAVMLTMLPIAIDLLSDWPGNVVRFIKWSVIGGDDVPAAGLRTAGQILARASSVSFLGSCRFPSFVDSLAVPMPSGLLPGAGLVLLIVAGVWVSRRGTPSMRSALVALSVLWVSTLVAIANLRGPMFDWLVGWVPALVCATWLTLIWIAVSALAPRHIASAIRSRSISLIAIGVVVLLIGALTATSAIRMKHEPFVFVATSAAAVTLSDAARFEADGRPISLGIDRQFPDSRHLMAGVLNNLDRDGVAVHLPDDWRLMAGAWRTATLPDSIRFEVAEQSVTTQRSGWREVAVSDQCDPATRAEVDQLTNDLASLLDSIGRADLVPLLSTTSATLVLAIEQKPIVTSFRADFERLQMLRRAGAQRYVLYTPAT